MEAFNYNIGIMSKFAYENFWKNVDKSLSISEKRKLYEQFYKENEAAINESVNELLEKTKTASFLTEGRVVNEGLFDRVKSKEEIDKSLSGSRLYKRLLSEGISETTIEKLKSVKLPDEGYGSYFQGGTGTG